MSFEGRKIYISLLLLVSFFIRVVPVDAQQPDAFAALPADDDISLNYEILLKNSLGDEYSAVLEKVFGADAPAAAAAFHDGSPELFQAVTNGAGTKAGEVLQRQIDQRRQNKGSAFKVPASVKKPVKKPVRRSSSKGRRISFNEAPKFDWRQLAFGFQSLGQDRKPDVQMTETDTEIKAVGTDKKSFETKDAKGTRTQKAETRYTKDGKTFGVEIKDTQIIEAVSKPDGKSFRRELFLLWGAEVAACPDSDGISTGTGKAKVVSKTIYSENGSTVTMISEFDLKAKLTGHVNDRAEFTNYDLELDAYTTNSGYENALSRNIIKEIKIKDGRYGLHYDIPGNTIEISDGKYGGKRTPAKMGQATARPLTQMSDADATLVGSAIGPMVPSIWNSANEMYGAAQKHWRNYGCVEVVCKTAKTSLEPGEETVIETETVHLQDNSKINAELTAEAYQAQITPESQSGSPGASFTFTQEGDADASFHVESVSKRGIGRGDVEFKTKKENDEPAEAGAWTGTIKAEREQRQEREKRSGANLAENGGYLETVTNVQLDLTGRLDRSVDASNAHIASVSGDQRQTDFEYDRYKVDEGYCGPSAVPYKGPKEITRTSATTAYFSKETRVFVEIGGTSGSITFSLPEQLGRTIHSYVHRSPCSEHDRANTNEAIDADVPSVGGSFSVSFPVDPSQKIVKGSTEVREDDGTVTTYSWELSRN